MKELCSALVKAQSEIGAAIKDSTNPHYNKKYADLSSVVSAIKPIAAKHGLGFFQRFGSAENGVAVETIIVHESGERLETGLLFVPASKQDAQGYGSAITYARRYSLQTAFGVPADDDDGHAAAASAPKAGVISPVKESAKNLDADPVKVAKVVSFLVDLWQEEVDAGVSSSPEADWDWSYYQQIEPLTQDERLAVWNALAGQSKVRSRIKKAQEAIKAREPKAAE
jgi:hypothetical protein